MDLYKREIGSLRDENRELKRKLIDEQHEHINLLAELSSERELRENTPGLKELYDQYMTMLILVRK